MENMRRYYLRKEENRKLDIIRRNAIYNLSPKIDEIISSRTSVVCRVGGATTADVQ